MPAKLEMNKIQSFNILRLQWKGEAKSSQCSESPEEGVNNRMFERTRQQSLKNEKAGEKQHV